MIKTTFCSLMISIFIIGCKANLSVEDHKSDKSKPDAVNVPVDPLPNDSTTSELADFDITSPVDGAEVSSNPTVSWSDASAASYTISIDSNNDCLEPFVESSSTSYLSYVIQATLTESVSYYVCVTAYDAAGNSKDANSNTQLDFQYRNTVNQWVHLSGTGIKNQWGVYGVKGVASPSNMPGARTLNAIYMDDDGAIWIFGGYVYDKNGNVGAMNDLWKFENNRWTWVGGSDEIDQAGVYDSKGSPSPTAWPGARRDMTTWVDTNKHLWVFSGEGRDAGGANEKLKDLWKWDGQQWTWVWGDDNHVDDSIDYGTVDVANSSNTPNGREYVSASWVDDSGFWFVGGESSAGEQSDVWNFDGSDWIFRGGSMVSDQVPVYGSSGVFDLSYRPGANQRSASWLDNNGVAWVFGGTPISVTHGVNGISSELWKWKDGKFAYVSGDIVANGTPGVQNFGTKGVSSPSNKFYFTWMGIDWIDKDNNLYFFGGREFDGTTHNVYNATIKFDGTNWVWVAGPSTPNGSANIGVKGVYSPTNIPGGTHAANSAIDNDGDLIFFGGSGRDKNGGWGSSADLWRLDLP